jgi:hypothetical protein
MMLIPLQKNSDSIICNNLTITFKNIDKTKKFLRNAIIKNQYRRSKAKDLGQQPYSQTDRNPP